MFRHSETIEEGWLCDTATSVNRVRDRVLMTRDITDIIHLSIIALGTIDEL